MEDFSFEEERSNAPAFPIERWTRLVVQKMSSGYTLVLNGKNARLFRRGSGFEPCPSQVAKLLIREGKLDPMGPRGGGTEYSLAPSVIVGDRPASPVDMGGKAAAQGA